MIMFIKFWLVTLGIIKAVELTAEAYMWIERKIKGKRK